MKYFVIFLILIGFSGTLFATDNQIVHIEHYQPDVELLPDNTVQYGKSFTIHAWLPMYDDKPEELQYFVDVLDSENNQVDSTLWFAKEDFVYEFDTTHPAYHITKGGTYFIKIEKADQLQRTGSFYKTLEFKINFPQDNLAPLKQFKSGISLDDIQCKDNLVLLQKHDGSPACVTEQTKQKLIERGYAIYTEFSINSTGVGYDDSITHLSFEVAKDNMIFDVSYAIKGGIVEDMIFSKNTNSLLVKIDSTDKGNLTLGIPRNLLDAKFDYCISIKSNPPDDTFIVLLDGEEIAYDEIATTNESRTLQIPFLENSTKIEVVATCLI